jgi:dTDP-4-dehydrorhamnose 3,5-epimerase
MGQSLNDNITLTPLQRIFNEKGDILKGLKCSDNGYAGFGEAYFSFIKKGFIKGWKKHTKMQLNIIVPSGQIKFYLLDEATKENKIIIIGNEDYSRLTVKPGVWMAFEGLDEQNMLLNIASIEHDPLEAVNEPLEKFLNYF